MEHRPDHRGATSIGGELRVMDAVVAEGGLREGLVGKYPVPATDDTDVELQTRQTYLGRLGTTHDKQGNTVPPTQSLELD
jgi:hypothetical protein